VVQPAIAIEPTFVVSSTETALKVGRIVSVDADFAVVLAGDSGRVAGADLVSIRRAEQPLPARPTDEQIVLANGDRVPGHLVGGDGLSVRIAAKLGENVKPVLLGLPLTSIAVVWLVPPTGDAVTPSWRDHNKKQDALLLRNGDVVRGTLEEIGMDGESLRFKVIGDTAAKPYLRNVVSAVALDPSLARVRLPKGAFAKLVLANGSRISVKSVTVDATTMSAVTLSGAKFTVPLAELIALDIFQGKAVYLSDLKPKKSAIEAYNGVSWPWLADLSVKGNPLRITGKHGESTHDKGLGVHSRTTLVYDLDGKYRRFESVVGLDTLTGKRGAVDIKVFVDGKEMTIDGLTGLTSANSQSINIDVSKAKELTLVVDYGSGGDLQDDANFVDARLVE